MFVLLILIVILQLMHADRLVDLILNVKMMGIVSQMNLIKDGNVYVNKIFTAKNVKRVSISFYSLYFRWKYFSNDIMITHSISRLILKYT